MYDNFSNIPRCFATAGNPCTYPSARSSKKKPLIVLFHHRMTCGFSFRMVPDRYNQHNIHAFRFNRHLKEKVVISHIFLCPINRIRVTLCVKQ